MYKEPIWGGKNLKEKYGKDIPSDTTGEAWEVAAHKNGQSTVTGGALDGKTLGEAIELLGKDLLGDYVAQKYPDKFPLLVKFLDCNDKLSVQVHPDDAYAKAHEKMCIRDRQSATQGLGYRRSFWRIFLNILHGDARRNI